MAGLGAHEPELETVTLDTARQFLARTSRPALLIDRSGYVLTTNQAARTLLDLHEPLISGRALADLVTEDLRETLRTMIRTSGETRTPRTNQFTLETATDVALRAECSVIPLATASGTVAGFVCTLDARAPGQAWVIAPTDPIEMGTWAWDARNQRVWWSPELETMCGLEPGTFAGTEAAFWAAMGEPDVDHSAVNRERAQALAAQGVVEYTFTDAHGVVHWLESRGRPFEPDDPDSVWIGVTYDVTARNNLILDRMKADLRSQEASLRAEQAEFEARITSQVLGRMMHDAPLGFARWDSDLRCISMNALLANAFHTTPSAAEGCMLTELAGARNPELADACRRVLRGQVEHVDLELTRHDGEADLDVWHTKVFPIRQGQAVTSVCTVTLDVTDLRRSERVERTMRAATELSNRDDLGATTIIRAITDLLVPDYADLALVMLTSESGVGLFHLASTPEPALPTTLADFIDRDDLLQRARRIASTPSLEIVLPAHALAGLCATPDIAVGAIIPILTGDAVVGALFLANASDFGGKFERRIRDVANELAARIGGVISAASLKRSAELARMRIDLLAQLGKLKATGSLAELDLEALNDVLVPTFADLSMTYVLHDGLFRKVSARARDQQLQNWLDTGFDPALPASPTSPSAEALAAGGALLINCSDVLRQPERYADAVRRFIVETRVDALLIVPIMVDDRHIGTLICAMTEPHRRFTDEDVAFAPELGRRIAPIIEAANRIERARAQTEALQRSLLPAELPNVFGYTLAAQYRAAESELRVGGDWYDVLELPDRSLLVAIGDVTGHGAFAAGLTGQLRTALRIAVLDTTDVGQLLGRLDQFLNGLPDFEMGTALLARLHRDTGELTIASAGHPAPLLRRANGTSTYVPITAGPPLGAQLRPSYQTSANSIEQGDCLMLFTDGLIERRHERIDQGFSRLESFSRSNAPDDQQLGACAIGVMDAMTTGYTPEDDIALVILHRAANVADTVFTITSSPDGIRTARREVSTFLEERGTPEPAIQDLTLVVSELCSNAMEHGDGSEAPILVRCASSPTAIELSVEDNGTWVTTGPRHGGRGLQIVRALADTVEVARTDPGTRVTVRRNLVPQTV